MGTYSRNTGGGSGAFQGHRLRGRPAGKAQRSAGTGGHGHRETERSGPGRGAAAEICSKMGGKGKGSAGLRW